MPGNPYYKTKAWERLREACLKRDGNRCTVPGCNNTYRLTADHIVQRKAGGSDTLSNLRTLCQVHHSQIRESNTGARGRAGKPIVKGCDASGNPLDPSHVWRR